MTTHLKQSIARTLRRRAPQGIDLGGGRMVAPEDLLEGHFSHLCIAAGQTADVGVATAPSLTSVIRVAAPSLAPLTQIAEQIAQKLPTMHPADEFRQELLKALEDAHRRRLEGAGERERSGYGGRTWVAGMAALLVAVGVAGLLLTLARRRSIAR